MVSSHGVSVPVDTVLLDAPCSNTGVLRRRVEARWRFDEQALAGRVHLQRRLLDSCARLVKPGGCLVYSTCSLEREENADQVAVWLECNPGWMLESERELFPPRDGVDGSYAARLRRSAG
jgi:16S rRNA (cytosine967-C5)-methyltransferase